MRNFKLKKSLILIAFAVFAVTAFGAHVVQVCWRMHALAVLGMAPDAAAGAQDPPGWSLAYGDWFYLIIYLVIAILSYALAPKPKPPAPEAPDPYGIDEFKVPTASAGREIPVVFGTRWIDSPNVVWYGHLRVEEKKEKTCT